MKVSVSPSIAWRRRDVSATHQIDRLANIHRRGSVPTVQIAKAQHHQRPRTTIAPVLSSPVNTPRRSQLKHRVKTPSFQHVRRLRPNLIPMVPPLCLLNFPHSDIQQGPSPVECMSFKICFLGHVANVCTAEIRYPTTGTNCILSRWR